MPISKHRGKSAVLAAPLNASHNNSSPLKIESVLPTLNRSPSKSIYRSYSTLSATNFRKTTNASPATEIENRLQNAQPSPSGFWRIQRTAMEKSKLPDRINLDRRGLTAMPIIEDEPQLRLLSLQHNLINSFSVPEPVERAPAEEVETRPSIEADNSVRASQPSGSASKHSSKSHQFLMQRSSTRNILPAKNQATNPCGFQGQKQQPNHIIKNTFIQKSVLLHAKQKYAFRKSSSFINSYSQHLAASKIHLGRLMDSSQNLNSNNSFSTDSGISDVESSKASPALPPQTPSPSNPQRGTKSSKNARLTASPTHNPATRLHETLPENLIIRNDGHLPTNNLQNLVFIDLYDNQIEKISSLVGLKSLTVLLLGKNRINDISGLPTVRKTLRVLDLHGNKITSITNKICQLQELKSLNLAGNNLKTVHADDFRGLLNLRELNLKRNKIKRINGFDDLRNLERLWLCHNDLQKVEDMASIAKAVNLKEVTVENNPVSLGGDCVSFLVSYLPCLVLLSQMQVTEQVRRAAMAWRKSKESSDTNYSHLSVDVSQRQRREEIISNARTNWELLRSQQHCVLASRAIGRSGQLQVPMSDVEMDLVSDISDLSRGGDRKAAIVLARQKTISNRVRTLKRTMRKHHKRSMSQENPETCGAKQSETEFFRLPPILAPFLAEGIAVKVASPQSPPSVSGSSLSPNVDSSSSYISSDNEETKEDLVSVDQDAEELVI